MNRYPGIQPFTADDSRLFCGRDREIKELSRLVVLNRITVLFGKSGTGKSSLLQAGVAPILGEWALQPLFIRLKNRAIAPEKQVFQFLAEGNYIPQLPPDLTLWEYFKHFDYLYAGDAYVPVVVFDQFEELFTLYTPEQRQTFIAQLADIVNGRVPTAVQQQIQADIAAKRTDDEQGSLSIESIAQREASPVVKIVLSIRSDFLYLLDRLSDSIPAILRCRYELHPLALAEAQRAIEYPAQLTNAFFSCPPFRYSAVALDNIINTLSGRALVDSPPTATQLITDKTTASDLQTIPNADPVEVEAFQLQLLCRQIEQLVAAQNPPQTPPYYVVQPDLYGGSTGIERILGDFYRQSLATFSDTNTDSTNLPPLRTRIQTMIEEALLNHGRRILQAQDYLCDEYRLSPQVLAQLADLRLLRKENYKNTAYYEISHDTLVAPILELHEQRKAAEAARRQAEEKVRLQAERAAVERKLTKERRRKTILGTFLGIALVALVAALLAWQRANLKERESQANSYAAQSIMNKNNTSYARQLTQKACFLQATPLALSSFWQSQYAYQWQWHDTLYYPPLYRQQIQASGGFLSRPTWETANLKAIVYLTESENNTWNAYIYTADDELLYTLPHKQPIASIAISPNGLYAMTDVTDGYQHLWSLKDGTQIDNFANRSLYYRNQTPLLRTHFSPDSRYLLVLTSNDTLHCRDLTAGQSRLLAVRQKPDVMMNQFAFSPDSKQLVILWGDSLQKNEQINYSYVTIHPTNGDNAGGKVLLPNKDNNHFTAIAFLDQQHIVTGNAEGYVQIWSTQNGKLLREWQACAGMVSQLDAINNGRYLLVAPRPANNQLSNDAILPNKQAAAYQCLPQYPAIWERGTSQLLNYEQLITLYGSGDEAVTLAYFADSNTVITRVNYDRMRRWRLNRTRVISAQINDAVLNSIWLPQQQQIHLITNNRRLYSFDAYGKEIEQQPAWAKDTLVDFSIADPYILTQAEMSNKKIHLKYWNTATDQLISEWTVAGRYFLPPLRLSPNGNYALYRNDRSELTLYYTPTATLKAKIVINSDINAIAIARNPENRFAVLTPDITSSNSRDTTESKLNNKEGLKPFKLSIYKGTSLQQEKILYLGEVANYALALLSGSSSNKVAVAAGKDILLLDKNYRNTSARLSGHSAEVTYLCTSPDERFLVSCSEDATVRIWDINTGLCLHTFTGHTKAVKRANFSADGRYLVSSGEDGRTFVWNLFP